MDKQDPGCASGYRDTHLLTRLQHSNLDELQLARCPRRRRSDICVTRYHWRQFFFAARVKYWRGSAPNARLDRRAIDRWWFELETWKLYSSTWPMIRPAVPQRTKNNAHATHRKSTNEPDRMICNASIRTDRVNQRSWTTTAKWCGDEGAGNAAYFRVIRRCDVAMQLWCQCS